MRYEAKSEREALEAAAKAMGRPVESIPYRVVRDEKSFWGGRVVEIEVEEAAGASGNTAAPSAAREAAVFIRVVIASTSTGLPLFAVNRERWHRFSTASAPC